MAKMDVLTLLICYLKVWLITSSCLELNFCFAVVSLTSLNRGQRTVHFVTKNRTLDMSLE